ncbi:MAG: glycosyltransferase, partial [Candidatus Coatesbacteria bacterium]
MVSAALVSVIITTRNRRHVVGRALDSVLRQSYEPKEILVADDASSDGTGSFVRECYPGVRLLTFEKNLGLVEARNCLMKQARGQYIVSLDDDAWFAGADAISLAVTRMERECAIAVATFRVIPPGGVKIVSRFAERYVHVFNGGAHCLRRSVLETVGFYEGHFFRQGEETVLAMRLLGAGYRIIYMASVVVVHDPVHSEEDRRKILAYQFRNTLQRAWLVEPLPWPVMTIAGSMASFLVLA